MTWRALVLTAVVMTALLACYAEPVAVTTLPPRADGTPISLPSASVPSATPSSTSTPEPTGTTAPNATASPTATPSSSATSQPTRTAGIPSGSPTAGCVNGWTRPEPGSPEHLDAITLIRAQMGATEGYTIDDMRYFTGPELPNVEPQHPVVERWYVRGEFEPGLRGRWLVERRTDQIAGVSAVAPYATSGYQSPDWTGFIGEGPPTPYLGLPGQWSGLPYDFVTGEGDGGFPGLPAEVVGCLDGT